MIKGIDLMRNFFTMITVICNDIIELFIEMVTLSRNQVKHVSLRTILTLPFREAFSGAA